jgi:hypothetical protein
VIVNRVPRSERLQTSLFFPSRRNGDHRSPSRCCELKCGDTHAACSLTRTHVPGPAFLPSTPKSEFHAVVQVHVSVAAGNQPKETGAWTRAFSAETPMERKVRRFLGPAE